MRLLIAHHTWLRRDDFRDRFTYTYFDTNITTTGIEWTTAISALTCDLACSPGEASLLRIAASLAKGIPVDLREAVTGLDRINTVPIAQAVTRASGHR
jgi:hypothetical protein